MKKIILSLLVVGVVAVAAVGGTVAYFTDTETSTGNTFTTGTIDIAVDNQNPWSSTKQFTFEDMKPSQVEYGEFVIHNVGSNPADVWKRIDITDKINKPMSEPECIEEGGTWVNPGGPCESNTPNPNIDTVIRYDMTVWVYDEDPEANPGAVAKWWQIIYTDDMAEMLSSRDGNEMLLGMVPAGWWMKVQQSYHMDKDTTNWAQGDGLVFNLTLTASQLTGTVEMENKDFADADNPTIVYDGVSGAMTYGVKDATFDWSFAGVVPVASTEYAAIFYYEDWSTPSATGWPRDVYVLAKASSDASGNVTMSGSEDFGSDIRNMKFWLVTTDDLESNILGADRMNAWNGNNYLFELGMMDYYDSN